MFGLSTEPEHLIGNRPLAFLLLAATIAFAMPNTQELFVRYRVAIKPEAREIFVKPAIFWRASMPWLLFVAVIGGAACFYQADFPQFLYWGF